MIKTKKKVAKLDFTRSVDIAQLSHDSNRNVTKTKSSRNLNHITKFCRGEGKCD